MIPPKAPFAPASGTAVIQTLAARARHVVAPRARILVALAILALAALSGILKPVDRALEAIRFGVIQREATGQVAVVAIDSRSLAEVGTWPWARTRFAETIRNLHDAGAGFVGFDVDFSARSSAQDDAALAEAIRASAGWVVLPAFLQTDGVYQNQPIGDLAENAVVGSVNIELDDDGRIRGYSRGREQGDALIPSMGAVLAGQDDGSTSAFGIDFGIRTSKIPVISIADVLNGTFDPGLVQGRSVLIGATAVELGDQFSTPASISTSGVLVHALAAETLLQGRAILSPPDWIGLGGAVIVIVVLWPRRRLAHVGFLFARHAGIAITVVGATFAAQALSPVSIDVAAILAAQAICAWEAIRLELLRRKTDLARQRERHLHTLAYEDPETGLPNRRAMQEHLVQVLANSDRGFATVTALGVESFGTLRAAIGSAQATEAVVNLATAMRQTNPGGSTFCLSPSTIGLVLTGDAARRADAQRPTETGQMSVKVSVAGQSIDLPVRAGVHYLRDAGATPSAMIDSAILALEHARERGMAVADQDDIRHIDPSRQLAIFTEIIPGLERGDFNLLYQRKTRADGTIIGAEALLRWNHPRLGPMRPDHFIPVSERTGSVAPLTRWVLGRSIADQMLARASGIEIPIAINVSGVLLDDIEYCRSLAAAIRAAEVDISLEITETAEIAQSAAADASIAMFRDAGVKIAIDDYGAGLSSLGYLKRIRAHELKLDKSLVDSISRSARDRLIVKSAVDLAHGLGMAVVAEGVEDDMSRVVLAALGCDCFQGYFFGRPEPIADLLAAIRAQAAPTAPEQPAPASLEGAREA